MRAGGGAHFSLAHSLLDLLELLVDLRNQDLDVEIFIELIVLLEVEVLLCFRIHKNKHSLYIQAVHYSVCVNPELALRLQVLLLVLDVDQQRLRIVLEVPSEDLIDADIDVAAERDPRFLVQLRVLDSRVLG